MLQPAVCVVPGWGPAKSYLSKWSSETPARLATRARRSGAFPVWIACTHWFLSATERVEGTGNAAEEGHVCVHTPGGEREKATAAQGHRPPAPPWPALAREQGRPCGHSSCRPREGGLGCCRGHLSGFREAQSHDCSPAPQPASLSRTQGMGCVQTHPPRPAG